MLLPTGIAVPSLLAIVLAIVAGAAPSAPAAAQGRTRIGGSAHQALPAPVALCHAEDARLNQAMPLKVATYDFIPVVPGGSVGYWQVYSARDRPNGAPGVGNNVNISVFDLGSGVLLFGTGYGTNPFPPGPHQGEPLFDAAFDAALVDDVVRGCIGLPSVGTPVDVVAPHGHVDHINGALLAELRKLGYVIRRVIAHEGDVGLLSGLPELAPEDFDVLEAATAKACQPLEIGGRFLSFATTAGPVWFVSRPGHTDGAVDLVLDVEGDPDNRFLIHGSAPGDCGVSGVQETIGPHGNAVIGD